MAALNSSGRRAKGWRDKEWVQHRWSSDRKAVPVMYYLCRNGHLDHPHFMQVPLSSPQALFLTDVIKRLEFLRGSAMPNLYSWASKRRYRNGFVWHDLVQDDIIYPVDGHEYVLKGSQLLQNQPSPSKHLLPIHINSFQPPLLPDTRRNCSLSSLDNKSEYNTSWKKFDAATQTVDPNHHLVGEYRNSRSADEVDIGDEVVDDSSSTTETASETVSRFRDEPRSADIRDQTAGNDRPSARMKASTLLMHFIPCVSASLKPKEKLTIRTV